MGSTGICPESRMGELIREQLIQGQDFAGRLRVLLQNPLADNWSELAGEFLAQILSSFERGLCLVGCSPDLVGENVLDSPVGNHQVSGFSSDKGGEGSEGSSRTTKRPVPGDRRGCYKRRKHTQTWESVTPTMEDGQAWRKYGQKAILNAKFPRSYFRCTHKYDQGCKATKQVQMKEDDSGMYKTTYIGFHTCKRVTVEPLQLIIPDYSDPGSDGFIGFSEHIKEEIKDPVETKSDVADNVSFCSLQDHSSFHPADQRFVGLEVSSHHQEDDRDTISRMYRLGVEEEDARSEMELLMSGSLGFDGDFPFDESDFSLRERGVVNSKI